MTAKQDEWVRLTLRLPPQLHRRLLSKASVTSLNAEIVNLLEWAVANQEPPTETEELEHASVRSIHDKLDAIIARLP